MQFFLVMSSSVVMQANPDIGITLLFLCLLIKTTPAPVLFFIAVTPSLLVLLVADEPSSTASCFGPISPPTLSPLSLRVVKLSLDVETVCAIIYYVLLSKFNL
jgi:hypothetical protein